MAGRRGPPCRGRETVRGVEMTRGWGTAVGVAVAVVLVAVVVAGVVTVRRSGTAEGSGATGGMVGDTGTTSTRLPSPDDSYWSPERMGDAGPAPMPPR
uniref:Uncharacterized protein n=1 Tax=Micromonospora echinospora TaxID=1877 RepID=Q2MG25_MICEC|nr:hypothetical protein [Micromonospora echinospora]